MGASHTGSFAPFSALHLSASHCSSLLRKEAAAGQGRLGTKSCLFMLRHHLQLPTLAITDQNAWRFSGLHLSLISGIFPSFEHLTFIQRFHPSPSSPPFFLTLLFHFGDLALPSAWLSGHPSSCFQIKQSRCSSTTCYQPCSR